MVVGAFYCKCVMKKGFFIQQCGSDNCIKLDARKNIDNLIIDMEDYEKRLENVRTVNHKFSIVRGYNFWNCLDKLDKKQFIYTTMDLKSIEI